MSDRITFIEQYVLFCFVWSILHKDEIIGDFFKPSFQKQVDDFLRKEILEDGTER